MSDIYYLTPRAILGAQRYQDLESMAKRIAEKKYGEGFKGVPVLVFSGPGGSFDVAVNGAV